MTAEQFASLRWLQNHLVSVYDSNGGGLVGAQAAMRVLLWSAPDMAKIAVDVWDRLVLNELHYHGFISSFDVRADDAVERYMSIRFGETAGDVDYAQFKYLLAWNAWCRTVLEVKRPKVVH